MLDGNYPVLERELANTRLRLRVVCLLPDSHIYLMAPQHSPTSWPISMK